MAYQSSKEASVEWELRVDGGKVVQEGADGVDAARRYAGAHPSVTVYAWRAIRYGLFIGTKPIVEPDPGK